MRRPDKITQAEFDAQFPQADFFEGLQLVKKLFGMDKEIFAGFFGLNKSTYANGITFKRVTTFQPMEFKKLVEEMVDLPSKIIEDLKEKWRVAETEKVASIASCKELHLNEAEDFGALFKAARRLCGITQEDVAKWFDITATMIDNWESDKKKAELPTLTQLEVCLQRFQEAGLDDYTAFLLKDFWVQRRAEMRGAGRPLKLVFDINSDDFHEFALGLLMENGIKPHAINLSSFFHYKSSPTAEIIDKIIYYARPTLEQEEKLLSLAEEKYDKSSTIQVTQQTGFVPDKPIDLQVEFCRLVNDYYEREGKASKKKVHITKELRTLFADISHDYSANRSCKGRQTGVPESVAASVACAAEPVVNSNTDSDIWDWRYSDGAVIRVQGYKMTEEVGSGDSHVTRFRQVQAGRHIAKA